MNDLSIGEDFAWRPSDPATSVHTESGDTFARCWESPKALEVRHPGWPVGPVGVLEVGDGPRDWVDENWFKEANLSSGILRWHMVALCCDMDILAGVLGMNMGMGQDGSIWDRCGDEHHSSKLKLQVLSVFAHRNEPPGNSTPSEDGWDIWGMVNLTAHCTQRGQPFQELEMIHESWTAPHFSHLHSVHDKSADCANMLFASWIFGPDFVLNLQIKAESSITDPGM